MAEVKKSPTKTTQKFVDISEIRDGIIVMPDGSMRVIMLTSAINFELKSETEQNSMVYAFASFLNSLDFPIQILVQSRRLELDDYLRKLADKASIEPNELIRLQIIDYVDFVRKLISIANIMDKKFYIVIPYYTTTIKKPGIMDAIMGTKTTTKVSPKDFETGKGVLLRRAESAAGGLRGLGIRSMQLKTQEIIELLYNLYNPETGLRQKIPSIPQITAEVVEQVPEMEIG